MIAVDTSALIAILFREPEAAEYAALIQANGHALVAAPTAFEFRLVARRQANEQVEAEAVALLATPPIKIIPFGPEHVDRAVQAFLRFGKGRHPAALNFGDCMAYALAREIGCPLLFKGNDFRQTDIAPVA